MQTGCRLSKRLQHLRLSPIRGEQLLPNSSPVVKDVGPVTRAFYRPSQCKHKKKYYYLIGIKSKNKSKHTWPKTLQSIISDYLPS